MQRNVVSTVSTLITGIVILVGSVLVTPMVIGQSAGIDHVPVTIEMVYTGFELDGSKHWEHREIFARRNDGSIVRITHTRAANGAPVEVRAITDVMQEKRTVLNSYARSKVTYNLQPDVVDELKSLHYECDGSRDSSLPSIFGYEVITDERMNEAFENIGSQRYVERYLAPELGCALLKEGWYEPNGTGDLRPLFTREVLRIELGDPDSGLFLIPDDYEEMSPGASLARRFSGEFDLNEADQALLQSLDDEYYLAR